MMAGGCSSRAEVFLRKTLSRLCQDAPFEQAGSRFGDEVASLYKKENTSALIIKVIVFWLIYINGLKSRISSLFFISFSFVFFKCG